MHQSSEKKAISCLVAGCAAIALMTCAGVASAQDFKVVISGDAKFQAAAVSQNKDDNSRNFDFRNRFRFWVHPEAKGLGGALTYGAKVRLRASGSDAKVDYDKMYIYGQGAFGKVWAGVVSTFSDDWNGNGSTAMSRPTGWHAEDDIFTFSKSLDAAYNGSSVSKIEAWRDKSLKLGDTKNTSIRYQTPFMAGFMGMVSYIPSSDNTGWGWNRTETVKFKDAMEVALRFDSKDKTIADKFGKAKLMAFADYQHATNGYDNKKDYSAYQFGAKIGYGDFMFGAEYLTWGKSGLANADVKKIDRNAWNVGAEYKYGDFIFGVGYNYSQKDVDYGENSTISSHDGKKSASVISAGMKYGVLKGVDLYLDYANAHMKNTYSNVSDTANVISAAVNMKF